MKIFIALAMLVACASAGSLVNVKLNAEWSAYKNEHSKVYSKAEDLTRRVLWEQNLKVIAEHNALAAQGVHSYTLGMNKFGDMTNQEFVEMMNTFNRNGKMAGKGGNMFLAPGNFAVPDSVDWRTQGYVTPIKDQKQCGSCWAFSAVASLEGQHFAKTKTLVSLSEQNLVDCSTKQGNEGCNGGLMDQAFDYIKANNGIDTEASYPYKGVDGTCAFDPKNVGATLTGYTDIPSGDETALTAAIASVGPIAVAIDASHITFQLYKRGVYYAPLCSSTNLDHGVTAVGYGVDAGTDYYIVKNSWGTVWGQEGYIWMSRGRNNNCGIATSASYPLV